MRMPWKYKLWIVGAAVLIGLGLIVLLVQNHASGTTAAAVPEVEVVQVIQKDIPVYREWIGTLDGLNNADVRAEVAGYLLEQGYQEGVFVKKGQLLFQI